jgi:hypothetical protein
MEQTIDARERFDNRLRISGSTPPLADRLLLAKRHPTDDVFFYEIV